MLRTTATLSVLADHRVAANECPVRANGEGQTENPPAATAYNDHQNMMDQLGVKKLRPGRNGQNQTGEGFDEATANIYKDSMPDALKMNDGTPVTRPINGPNAAPKFWKTLNAKCTGEFPKMCRKLLGK